jgi:hypothetical protein
MKYTDSAIDAFARFSKRADILTAARIGRTKFYLLRNDPDFMRLVNARRTEIVTQAVQEMEANLLANTQKLQRIIDEAPERAQVTLNALTLYFNTYRNLKNDSDILARIDALEAAITGRS